MLGNIRVLKKDADTGEPLSGVVIGLFDMDGNGVSRGVIEAGELLFEGIRYGRYELRELEAKEGYLLLEEPVPVEISEHGQTVTVELTNHEIPEIPQTGDSSGIWFCFLSAITSSAFLICLRQKSCRTKR